MKPMLSPLFAALVLAAGLSHAAAAVSASEPPHDPASHAGHAPPTDHGAADPAPAVRWLADAPLARGMQRVRSATQALAHGAHGHLDAEQVKAVAVELDAAVQAMFAQCRLEPEPDAALHPLLARVLQASTRLADGQFHADALAELEAVLARYPLLFEDAGWSSPSERSEASTSTPLRASHVRSNSVSS